MRLLLVFLLLSKMFFGQTVTVWSEDFGNGCNQGQLANGFSSANGTWNVSNVGGNGDFANEWYVSATEQIGAGDCGEGCGGDDNRTLHVSSTTLGDVGAAYDAGGVCGFFWCVFANKRVESPIIDLSGETDLTLTFDYIEFGQNGLDNAELWYFDGASWSLLDDTPKTDCCGGVTCDGTTQGEFTNYSIALPASAENNPNVRIGFFWTNNDDGLGTDPSFAVDNIEITTPDVPLPVTLSDYNLECKNDQNLITWTTESELNNRFFIVEKSFDGNSWSICDTINGNGTTTKATNYSYLDRKRNLQNEITYYKVTQYDYDNTNEELFILSSNCIKDNEDLILYPNPSKNEFYLNLNTDSSNDNLEIKVYSSTGRLVLVKNVSNKKLIKVNHQLKNGTYTVEVSTKNGENLGTKRLVVAQ